MIGDCEVGKTLLQQPRDQPAMGEGLQFGPRAEVAQEARQLVAAAQAEDGFRQRVQLADILAFTRIGFCYLVHFRCHVNILTCPLSSIPLWTCSRAAAYGSPRVAASRGRSKVEAPPSRPGGSSGRGP